MKGKTTPVSQRELIAANVRRLMDRNPDLDSPDKLARRSIWPYGNKKAGKSVGARTIRYLLDIRQPKDLPQALPAPSVDLLVAIAAAFGKQPWELLADDEQTRHYLVTKLINAAPAPDERLPQKFKALERTKR